jgi:hypothetical protein
MKQVLSGGVGLALVPLMVVHQLRARRPSRGKSSTKATTLKTRRTMSAGTKNAG